MRVSARTESLRFPARLSLPPRDRTVAPQGRLPMPLSTRDATATPTCDVNNIFIEDSFLLLSFLFSRVVSSRAYETRFRDDLGRCRNTVEGTPKPVSPYYKFVFTRQLYFDYRLDF